jgi:hypothetical protein
MNASAADQAELQTRRRLRNAMLLLLTALVAFIVLALVFWPQGAPAPQIDVADVAGLEFDFSPTSGGQPGWQGGANKLDVFADLINVLNSGRETKDHKCIDTGRIVLKLRDKRELHYGTLSGHDWNYYEFRAYGDRGYKVYRVAREEMAAALQKMGLDRLDEPRPE